MIVINKFARFQTATELMEKPRSFQQLLRDHSVSADDFFQTQGIAGHIRGALTRFVKYCRTHRHFTTRMIYLALNVSYTELQDPRIRTASYAINEMLANEETELVELFFDDRVKAQTETAEIPEELQQDIKSEAERLFRFDSDEEEKLPPEQVRPEQIAGLQLVDLSFQILRSPERNETCLGHLQKMYSFFVRHDPIPVLAYLQQHDEVLRLMLDNLSYSSVSSLLAQLLTSQDKNKEYRFEGLKRSILQRAIEQIFKRLDDQVFFDGALIFLEEILNTTKQSYYQYFQDFKRISNYLVSAGVLGRFFDELIKLHEPSFGCISRFLQSLFSRLNSELEESYHQKEESAPSMNFQIDIFVESVPTLLLIVPQIQSFNSLTKISYLSFLEVLLTSAKVKASSPNLNDPSFLGLFEAYRNQKHGGIVKRKIYSLINGILSRETLQNVKSFVAQHPNIYNQYFGVIKAANYSNTKTYNRNQGAAFDVSLIGQLTRKEDQALGQVSELLGKNFKRICKKYDTKIASFQNNSTAFSLQEQSNFYQYNTESNSKSNGESSGLVTGFSLTFVGKNSISIPTLHIPEKQNNSPEHQEGRENPREERTRAEDDLKEVFQIEEVVVLTQNLDRFRQVADILSASENQAKQLQKTMPKIDIANIIEQKSDKGAKQIQQIKQKANSNQAKAGKQQTNTDNHYAKTLSNKVEAIKNQAKAGSAQSLPISIPNVIPVQQKLQKSPPAGINTDKTRFFTRHLVIFS